MARTSLANFITEHMTTIDPEKGSVVAILLQHYQGSATNEVRSFKIGSEPMRPVEIAKVLQNAADNHAGGIPGVQQYEVLIFNELTNDAPQGRYPFRLDGERELGGLGTEAPTNQGLTMQLMRHNEGLVRGLIDGFRSITASQNHLIERQAMHIEKLQTENMDAVELAKELLFREATQQHDLKMKEQSFARATLERKEIMRHLPSVVNTITGRKIFPESSQDTAIVEGLVESLTTEQTEKLLGILSPAQQALVMDRFVEIINRKQKEAAQQESQNGTPQLNGANGHAVQK